MKHLICIAALLLFISFSQAQSPQGLNYQAIARDTAGNLLTNREVTLRFSIHDTIQEGTVVYSEINSANTNMYGLFTTIIGNGIAGIGSFAGINWAAGNKYLQVEIDVNGGSDFRDMGTTQLMSVPFALYALHSGDTIPKAPANVWQQSNTNVYYNGGNVGIGTATPAARLQVADSSVVFSASGTIPGTAGSTPVSGPGRRAMWYADKAAFRSGEVNGIAWDKDSIGNYSFAAGYNTRASGAYASALGRGGAAEGNSSFTTGIANRALGDGSVALGTNTAAFSFSEIVMGMNNTLSIPASSTSYNAADRLLVLGNGADAFSRSDAMVVLKNGNTGLGVASPAQRLDVNGNIHLTGTVTVQNNRGIIRNNANIQLKKVVVNVQVNTTITAGTVATVTVNWSESFSIAPEAYVGNITGGVGGGTQVVMTLTSCTTTGATLNIYNPKTSSVSPNFYVNIIAVGAE